MKSINRRISEWWHEPDLKPRKVRVPSSLKDVDPLDPNYQLPQVYRGTVGAFKPSRKWVNYNRIGHMDVGYLVPVYDLRAIGKRYGLTHNAQTYFRKHILPEPFDIVRRRSVNAHHWSHYTLLALDVVLQDLEKRGYNQILKHYEDHVDLVHIGSEYLATYYAEKYEEMRTNKDSGFGVTWLD